MLGVTAGEVRYLARRGHVRTETRDGRLQVEDDSAVARVVEEARWVSRIEAARIVGCAESTLGRYIDDGEFVVRHVSAERRR